MSRAYPPVAESLDDIDPDRLYSCHELAHAVKYAVSDTTIWRRVRDGILPSVPQAKDAVRVRGADFLEWWRNPPPRARSRRVRKKLD